MLKNILALMDRGNPVSVVFTKEQGTNTDLLYCELIQKARFGDSFLMREQRCRVGKYVFGKDDTPPSDYYYESGRYKNKTAAGKAVSSLHRLAKQSDSMRISPYSGEDFDILILFLKPEPAMRIIQSLAYHYGKPVGFTTGGTASVCSDCTAYPQTGEIGISLGCKGSRKHGNYSDDELVVGIPFELAGKIDEALGKTPKTHE